ncbi:MAG: Lrp/AsnC family transcriptional regulator [Candidatus Pacearchaeota archaeon]|jgi:DNA-binding Lrp family transcriptional regulator
MESLDKFDLKFLVELEKDSRQPISNIAKTLKTSQQVLSYRLANLEKKEIILGFYTVINFVKLGYTSYRTMIRLSNMSPKMEIKLINYLKENGNVSYLAECTGHWDLIVDYLARNIVQYYCFLKDLRAEFPENVSNIDVLTTLENIYFGRDYFAKKYREINKKSFICSEDLTPLKLDSIDLKVLFAISKNARVGSVEVAGIVDTSPNTIIYRIKELQEKNIIEGFKPHLNIEKTGRIAYKSLIKFNNINESQEEELITYLQNNMCVFDITKVIGYWDFEIDFEVQSTDDMIDFTRLIRDKFRDLIKEFETTPIHKEHLFNYFPGDLLDTFKKIKSKPVDIKKISK